ncbi:MAG: Flp pilus assembly complex ATPase component TadA [Clostridiales bacterium]|nr:Flp pilus assembly complex ATPase component TadA [Clostridiales bacterium]
MAYDINLFLLLLVSAIICLLIFYLFKRSPNEDIYEKEDNFSVYYLVEGIKETFNQILNSSITQYKLDKAEALKEEKRKDNLRQALRNCNYGDTSAKDYIKEYIKDLLQLKFNIDENTINLVIPFNNPYSLTIQDKFEILLYYYKKDHGTNALQELIRAYDMDFRDKELDAGDSPRGYEIREDQIEEAYRREISYLNYNDKLEVVSQRIYQLYKGHGVIDELRDMNIDGISAGVSGLTNVLYQFSQDFYTKEYKDTSLSYNSIWIFYQGKTIQLSFLGFGSQKELERVCKNIYRYDYPGQLSSAKGYIANEMKDGSRVIVVRPPFAESWAFFVRKFQSVREYDIYDILPDKGNKLVIELMRWLIKGCKVIAITGEQGSGKSTLLKYLISFIDPTYTLRVQELIFELNLRKLYPKRNILSFRETQTVSGQEALDIQKKTDGVVTVLGEVASAPVARWLVQLSQVASKFTIFTHHAKSTDSLVTYLRNALLQEGGFNNEKVAQEQVVEAVNFDIHFVKNVEGHRFIERITEIVPLEEEKATDDIVSNMGLYFKQNTRRHVYKAVDILRFEEGEYKLKVPISKRSRDDMAYNLTKEEQEDFMNFINRFPKVGEG